MDLYIFHRVLISAAIVFDFFFTFWSIRQFRAAAETDWVYLGLAIGSSIVTVLLIAYLVYFNRSLTMLRHALSDQRRQLDTAS